MREPSRLMTWERATGQPCWYCGVIMEGMYPDGTSPSIDHKLPRSLGGTNDGTNLVFACRACNSRKTNKTIEEFREWCHTRRINEAGALFTPQQIEWLDSHGLDVPPIIESEFSDPVVFYGESHLTPEVRAIYEQRPTE